ncbi:MAG: hypothetical protein CMF61_00540 [Magnetococcales bacterium]|nr:hypothetical protein [Magnetococcales bacterium]PPR17775.1 MAG: hypothetical protein CFH43_00641 [Pseudomonadota bacterium]|tara:strand:- start:2628 stop:3281 length:654 start_codon:yes stop_codon:yes gene_type:complete
MPIKRSKNIITRDDLRPELIQEMQEKEHEGCLNAETDIIPYYFYLATAQNNLKLYSPGTQTPSCVFESAYRSKAQTPQQRMEEEARNMLYAQKCAYQLIMEGKIPYGSHIKYNGPLDDANSHHRTVGIVMGKLEEINVPEVQIFPECGVSTGIIYGSHLHVFLNKKISVKSLRSSLWVSETLPVSLEDGYQIVKEGIWQKEKEIIQAIDEKLGVKTL